MSITPIRLGLKLIKFPIFLSILSSCQYLAPSYADERPIDISECSEKIK